MVRRIGIVHAVKFALARSRLSTGTAAERIPWHVDLPRAGRALGRIADELRLQIHQIGEDVRLAPQLVGDHRRLA